MNTLMSNYQYSHHSSPHVHVPFQTRFNSAIKQPLTQRCYDISQLINESISTNIKDMQMNYVPLIESIFGFGTESASGDWGLKLIARNLNSREFDAIYAFLEPNGALFQLMRQLMTDPNNRYEFPKSLLPIPTKISLEDGIIPNFYINKIASPIASITVSLNAFEFYLFHFTHYILNINTQSVFNYQNPFYLEQLNNANANPSNIIYYAILEAYLKAFVPLSDVNDTSMETQQLQSQSSLWQSLSSTTSNLLHLGNAQNVHQSPSQTSTLFKTSLLNLKPLLNRGNITVNSQHVPNRLSRDPLGADTWKCDTILLIIGELWLNHSVPQLIKKQHQNVSPNHRNMFTPNSDHMRAVRILIKHLHYFVNSLNQNLNDKSPFMDLSPFEEVKRSLWTQKYSFQKKLYSFLRLSFERWPNDASLRIPLETWLSYIQPWRYVNPYSETQAFEMDDREQLNTSANPLDQSPNLEDSRWKKFIAENLLFYTVIFRQLMPRFLSLLDLTSAKNAYMLFRISKVFSQTKLIDLIKKAEVSFVHNEIMITSNSWSSFASSPRGTLLSPSLRSQSHLNSLSLRHPLIELESSDYEYVSLFTHATKLLIMQLLNDIAKARAELSEIIISETCKSDIASVSGSGIIQFIKSMFQFDDDSYQSEEIKKILNEKRKTDDQLKTVSNRLSKIFDLPQPNDIPTDIGTSITDQTFPNDQNTPSFRRRHNLGTTLSPTIANSRIMYEDDNGSRKLTPHGKHRFLNGLYKPEIGTYEGNPDSQPIRTFEFAFLVKIFLLLSSIINNKYGDRIKDLYFMNTFMGLFFRQFVSPPITYVRVIKSGTARPPERITEILPPRVNLRFLANKTYIAYAIVLTLIVYFLRFNILSFAFLCFAMTLMYMFTKTLLIYLSANTSE